MAAVASNFAASLPQSSDVEINSSTSPISAPRKLSLSSATGSQAFPRPPFDMKDGMKGLHNNSFANWHNYNMNQNVRVNYQPENHMPSPPSTMSSYSPVSSNTSSPAEMNTTNNEANAPSYFQSHRPRSNSVAIPMATSTCPNCGLRRPSSVSDQTISPMPSSPGIKMPPHLQSFGNQRTHLPIHLHCPDACPDSVFPTRSVSNPILNSPLHKRHHRRRRSSLCYAETMVEDADELDSGGVPIDVKAGWEKQAANIARRVVMRKAGLDVSNDTLEEEAIED